MEVLVTPLAASERVALALQLAHELVWVEVA